MAFDALARVRDLSDEGLLVGLAGLLGTGRRLLAEVLAHLGEVEERRLDLRAGYGSMFAYCTLRLGMSEDEACRRIDVARLVRRFPLLLERLASGRISLSVAALLKPCLTDENFDGLVEAVSDKTVQQAREVLAAWFPKPDVVSSIRKLPVRRANPISTGRGSAADVAHAEGHGATNGMAPDVPNSMSAANGIEDPSALLACPPVSVGGGSAALEGSVPMVGASISEPAPVATKEGSLQVAHVGPFATSRNVEPLSPGRYKVQLTATAALKEKLELARDLLRHVVPSGDIAEIIERALDLLLDETLKRRFASRRPRSAAASSATREECAAAPAQARTDETAMVGAPAREVVEETQPLAARHIPNEVRRAVLERDGARCSWESADGGRCNSRAWLEFDHVVPRGRGGGNGVADIRLVCRAHNGLAAEQAYGRDSIARCVARRRAAAAGARAGAGEASEAEISANP